MPEFTFLVPIFTKVYKDTHVWSRLLNIGQVLCVQYVGVGVCLFVFFLIDREEVEVNKSVKKRLKTIFRHLEQTSLASNGLIILPKRELFRGPRRVIPSGHWDWHILQEKSARKNLAILQPYWPHAWWITHIFNFPLLETPYPGTKISHSFGQALSELGFLALNSPRRTSVLI